jgi:hypothetical protein
MRRFQIALIALLYAVALGALLWENVQLGARSLGQAAEIARLEQALAARDVELRDAHGALRQAGRDHVQQSAVQDAAAGELAALRAHALEIHGCTLKPARSEALGRVAEASQVSGDPPQ